MRTAEDRAARYWELALKLRKLAVAANPPVRGQLLSAAAQYERFAQQIERSA